MGEKIIEKRTKLSLLRRWVPWYYKKLAHRLNAMLMVMILLSVSLSVIVAIYYVRQETIAEYRTSVQRQLGLVENSLSQYIDHIRYNTQMIAQMPIVQAIDNRVTTYVNQTGVNGLIPMEPWKSNLYEYELYEMLGTFQKNHPAIKNASIGVASNGGFIKYPASPRFDGYDARERSWYQLAMDNPRKVMVSGIYTTSTDEKVILSVRTIHDARDAVVGVVTVDFDLQVLSETISGLSIGDSGFVILVDSGGIVLAHPKQNESAIFHPRTTTYVGKSLKELGYDVTKPGFYEIEQEGQKITLELIPSREEAIGLQYLVVIPSEEFSRSGMRIAIRLLISAVPLILLAVILGAHMTRRMLRPINDLRQWSEVIAAGQLDQRIDLHREDELGQLARQFNTMAAALESARNHLEDQVDARTVELSDANSALKAANQELIVTLELLQATQQQLIQSEKLAGLSAMVAGIAHEMNTPLGIAITMSSYLEIAHNEEPLQRDKLVEITEILHRNLKRTSHLIERFKQVAVDQASEIKRAFDLDLYIREHLQTLKYDERLKQIDVVWTCESPLMVDSYPGTLGTVITQLIENAYLHAYEGPGSVILNAKIVSEGDALLISYQDYGKGIDEQTKSRLFEPFYTTNRSSGGTGLGLFVVYNSITLQLGGTITVTSEEGEGLTLEMQIPL